MRATASEVSFNSSDPGVIPGMVVGEDRACPKCGYNVRGIAIGKPCPECGRAIYFGIQACVEHPLSSAPYWYLWMTHAALWGTFVSLFGAGLVWAARTPLGDALPLALGGAAMMWVASLTLLCLPRPSDRTEGVALPDIPLWKRAAAVGSQSIWLVAAAVAAMAPTQAWAGQLLPWLLLPAGFGIIPTMLLMADVAEFAGDADRGRRLTQTAIVLLVLVGLSAMGLQLRVSLPITLGTLFGGVALLPFFLIVSGVLLIWNFFQLAQVGGWAIQVARREDERVEKLRERFNRERSMGAQAVDNEPFGGPVQAPVGSMMGLKPTKR